MVVALSCMFKFELMVYLPSEYLVGCMGNIMADM